MGGEIVISESEAIERIASTSTLSPILSTLSVRLAEPIPSVQYLLELLVPALALLQLLSDRPDLISTQSPPDDVPHDERKREVETFTKRQLAFVQKIVLEKIWIDWALELEKEEIGMSEVVLGRWLAPLSVQEGGGRQGGGRRWDCEVAISAYSVLGHALSRKSTKSGNDGTTLHPMTLELAGRSLQSLVRHYNVDTLFQCLISPNTDERENAIAADRWERVLRDLFAVPTKVANAYGMQAEKLGTRIGIDIPDTLVWARFSEITSCAFVTLLWRLAGEVTTVSPSLLESLAKTLDHLAAASCFPSTPNSSPSFFASTIFPITQHILPRPFPAPVESVLRRARYAELWRGALDEVSQKHHLSQIGLSFLKILDSDQRTVGLLEQDRQVRSNAFLLGELFGPLSLADDSLAWTTLLPLLLESKKTWSVGIARVVICWIDTSSDKASDRNVVLEKLLLLVMEVWGNLDSVANGSVESRTYLSTLLLLTINALPLQHPAVIKLSRSRSFLSAISAHLGLLRPTQRFVGMLVAEIVSARSIVTGGPVPALSFGDLWDGDEEERAVARGVRELVGRKLEGEGWQDELRSRWTTVSSTPVTIPRRSLSIKKTATPPAAPTKRPLISIINDDPDELRPFPLPPAPSDEYIESLASTDAGVYSTTMPSASNETATRRRGKLRAPVYIPELVAYLKGQAPEGGKEQEDEVAQRIEMGLREGEGLIRRKRGWGGELVENAVDLAFAAMLLQDMFETDNFDQLKQQILVALVASAPRQVVPAIVEQYFIPQYSISQRHALLTSLALGSRELAGFSAPTAQTFLASHTPRPDSTPDSIELFPSKKLPPHLHRQMIEAESSRASQQEVLPRGALEQITEEMTRAALSDAREDAEVSIPEAAREKLLTVRRFASAKSKSTGVATIDTNKSEDFSTLAAEIFIMPLINRFWLFLRDSSYSSHRTSGSYAGGGGVDSLLEPLSVVKFFSTLSVLLHAARHSPHFLAVLAPEAIELVLALRTSLEEANEEVVASQMELLLVVFDATAAQDYGRTLLNTVTNGARVVGEAKDWAEEVFDYEERKGSVGRGGIGRSGRAAAGVLLRIEEMLSRWRGTVGW